MLMSVLPDASAGNPVIGWLTWADNLLQKIYNKVDYDTTYISRSPGKIGIKAWGNVSGAKLKGFGGD